MVARRGVLVLAAGTVAAALTGCGLFERRARYRFRMTVEVETSQGMRSGSSVMQVSAVQGVKWTSETHAGGAGVQGEAVIVDLPTGPIFVLLTISGDGGPLLATEVTVALNPKAKPGSNQNWSDTFLPAVRDLGSWFGGASAELPRRSWPMMVRFRDINDSRSVELVDPDKAGVKRIMLQTTSDDVSSGIRSRLRWLQDGGLTLDPNARWTSTPTPPLAQVLRQSKFKAGGWQ